MQQPPVGVPSAEGPLAFGYENTGVETYFRDDRDPDARSRRLFLFMVESARKITFQEC